MGSLKKKKGECHINAAKETREFLTGKGGRRRDKGMLAIGIMIIFSDGCECNL